MSTSLVFGLDVLLCLYTYSPMAGGCFFITGERRCLVYFILVFGDEKFVYIPLVTNV